MRISDWSSDGCSSDLDKAGFNLIAQGFAGLMSITGEPGRPPVKTGNSIADINAGILVAAGIMAAYVHKLKTGQGQVVDTSLMERSEEHTSELQSLMRISYAVFCLKKKKNKKKHYNQYTHITKHTTNMNH